MAKRGYKLKLIQWHDSRGVGSRWNRIEHVVDDGICKMQSIGWVIKETKTHVCVAPHMGLEDDGDDQVCGEMHIPKSCIDKMITIKQ